MKTAKITTCLLFTLTLSQALYATTGTAISNGNWSSPSTWSFGRAPGNNDTIVVPFSKTVTVDINSPTYTRMVVIVKGTLSFNNGKKLDFDCNSVVSVTNTGVLSGGNPGSKINMCGITEWRGPGPNSGPFVYGYNPLPIKLIAFAAHWISENVVQLNWTTGTEINNDFFTIERSRDGNYFESISTQKGAGNSFSPISYEAEDALPYAGINYYRLRQKDYDGKTTVFNIVSVINNSQKIIVNKIFPNPANTQISFDITLNTVTDIEIELLDATGNCMERKAIASAEKALITNINTSQLATGIYCVKIKESNGSVLYSGKIAIEK